jgi:hypothetical protein
VVTSASAGINYTFNNVVIASPFAGYSIGKQIEDYSFPFYATVPDITELTTLINYAATGINNI